jgi:potassium-transporting ATPase KdpC subunit
VRSHLRPAFFMLVALSALTGIAYPLSVTAVAQALFPRQSNGSLVRRDGKVVGSELIGQTFSDPKWFWGRPSATSPYTNAAASSGSNLGPTNPALADAVKRRVEALLAAQRALGLPVGDPIPVDLVAASGSGLDPDVSPAAARWQVARVAKARGLSPGAVGRLVEEHVEERTLGLLGEPRVNVLRLNLALNDLR